MKMRLAMRWCLSGALFLAAAGCAGLMTKLDKPEVSIAGIKLVEPGLLEQRYRIQLRVHNPNEIDLPIDGISFRIDLNHHSFASGESAVAATVPRFGSALVEVDAVSTLAGFARQISEIASNQTLAAHYAISGKLHVSRPSASLPFSQQGEIALPGFHDKPAQ